MTYQTMQMGTQERVNRWRQGNSDWDWNMTEQDWEDVRDEVDRETYREMRRDYEQDNN